MVPEDIPDYLEKATAYSCGRRITLTGSGPILPQTEDYSPSTEEIFMSLQCEYSTQGNAQALQEAIIQGIAVAVSDGSYQLEKGAAAWTIEGVTAENRILGVGPTPGGSSDHSAYRSKLFGLWGIMMSLHRFTKDHQIANGHVTIACDGLSALRKAQNTHMTEPSEAHYDLILAIRALQKSIPLQLTFQHVKGHQNRGQTTVLPHLAWMNIKMDERAKQKVLEETPAPSGGLPYEGWICKIEGNRIINHLTAALRTRLNGTPLLNHWMLKNRFQQGQATDVDWEMAARATQALPRVRQRWTSKLTTKFLLYGTNMARWNLCTQTQCPRCSCPKEDKEHLLRCPAESAVTVWKKALDELDNWMAAAQTHPQIRQDIIAGLSKWHNNDMTLHQLWDPSLAVTLQDGIGWG